MKISLAYGKQSVEIDVPEKNLIDILESNAIQEASGGEDAVRKALEAPIASKRLGEIVQAGEKVCIITSDISRPMPSAVALPPVLEELNAFGIPDEDITIVFALGIHRSHSEEEMRKLVGDKVFERIRCIDAVGEYILVGHSSRGTPYEIFSPVVQADRRICMGNIEYHYFAGYSGGAKAIMPGVSTRGAIQANHSRMVEAAAMAGKLEGNPVREDIDEVASFVPIDFIVNVVLDEHKAIRHCVCGHYIQAHREGCKLLDDMYRVPIAQRADIIVVSPGGYPKDINLYQAQKALDNAKHAVRDNGRIILVASCIEGLGEDVFERWMQGHEKASDMIDHIEREFELGGHKAAAIAMVLEKVSVILVSDLEDDFVRGIHLTPCDNAQKALDQALEKYGDEASVIVMPFGGATLPSANGIPKD